MRPRRRSVIRLDQLTGSQMVELAQRGLMSWQEVNEATRRRVMAANGGVDPYAHLREEMENPR